jgi:hypothetical protein
MEGMTSASGGGVTPRPDDRDRTVQALVLEELARYEPGVADVQLEWSNGGRMWVTQVTPLVDGAAPFSIAAEDEDTLNCTFGHVWMEVFGRVEDRLPLLRELVVAVLSGNFEETRSRTNARGRFHTASGTVSGGAMQLPLPWRLRRVRRYTPYGNLRT